MKRIMIALMFGTCITNDVSAETCEEGEVVIQKTENWHNSHETMCEARSKTSALIMAIFDIFPQPDSQSNPDHTEHGTAGPIRLTADFSRVFSWPDATQPKPQYHLKR